jgi:cation diffusion facilitator family transporter
MADANHGESRLTVLLALAANVGIGLLKLIAGLLAGSGAMLAEAAHSAGDSSTEVLLLTALRRSRRPADRVHPFGYGKERYFWSLLAAVAIFISGAMFSFYIGIHTIVSSEREVSHLWLSYLVIGLAAVMEATSLVRSLQQARREAAGREQSVGEYVHNPDDPTVKSVVLEDSAALIGLALAAGGIGLHAVTGSAVWDGLASLCIGVLLVVVATMLAQTCKSLLIGQQADVRLVRRIETMLEEQPEVEDVVDLLTMQVGTDRVLVCARVDFIDDYSAADLEEACLRIDADLRNRFTDLDEIFIQPVPRSDPDLRQRVLARYGRALAEPE